MSASHRVIDLNVICVPQRPMTITWSDGVTSVTSDAMNVSIWRRTVVVPPGRRVSVIAQDANGIAPGYTQCTVYVDGVIPVNVPNSETYAHQNNTGACAAWLIVPGSSNVIA